VNTVTISTPYDSGVAFQASTVKGACEFLLWHDQFDISGCQDLKAAILAALPHARAEAIAANAKYSAEQSVKSNDYAEQSKQFFDDVCKVVVDFEKASEGVAFWSLESVFLDLRMNCGAKVKAAAIQAAPKKLALITPFLDVLEKNLPLLAGSDYRSEVEEARRLQRKLREFADMYKKHC
jgi:hypothetical protein